MARLRVRARQSGQVPDILRLCSSSFIYALNRARFNNLRIFFVALDFHNREVDSFLLPHEKLSFDILHYIPLLTSRNLLPAAVAGLTLRHYIVVEHGDSVAHFFRNKTTLIVVNLLDGGLF